MTIDHETKTIRAEQYERMMVANYIICCVPNEDCGNWRVIFNDPVEVRSEKK